LIEHDEYKLQCTGIDQDVFNDLEASLAKYLEEEFVKFPSERLSTAINAFKDISCLNRQDPQYSFELTPHVYFIQYSNVYVFMFLIYKFGMLPNLFWYGPGVNVFGIPQMHLTSTHIFIQYRLQVLRLAARPQQTATNAL